MVIVICFVVLGETFIFKKNVNAFVPFKQEIVDKHNIKNIFFMDKQEFM